MKAPSAWLMRWHRRAGIVACIGVLAWSLSGISHPLMTRLQPRPATQAPPAQSLDLSGALPLAQVLERQRIAEIAAFRVVRLDDAQYYQVTLPGQPVRFYFSIEDGSILPQGDRQYAERLARHFTGDYSAGVIDAEVVTQFDDDYPSVNRLLPAWRIRFAREDRLRAYVDTGSSRLGTLTDGRKAVLATWFRTLHTWEFAGEANVLRVSAMTALLASAFFAALAGLWLYAVRWRSLSPRPTLRRWHRGIAIAVSLSTLLFAFSGAWHAWQSWQRDVAPLPLNGERFAAEAFGAFPLSHGSAPVREAAGSAVGAEPAWRVAYIAQEGRSQTAGEHAAHGAAHAASPLALRYVSARTGAVLPDGEHERAVHIARRAAGEQPVLGVEPVTRFGGEYGFVFKRLPVQRVTMTDGVRYYVETSSGEIAARIDGADAREGWTFAYLHKWDGLKHLVGADARDAIVALFALGNASTAALGLALFLRRRRVVRTVASATA
jgi:hypothetical protein